MPKANKKAIDNSLGFNIRFVHGLVYPKFTGIRQSNIKRLQKIKQKRIKLEKRIIKTAKIAKQQIKLIINKNKKSNKLLKKEQQIKYGFDLVKWWNELHK